MRIKSHYLLWGGGVLALFIFAVPHFASAGIFDVISLGGIFDFFIRAIALIFQGIAGGLYTLGSVFVGWMLDLNFNVLSQGNQIITIGWKILRDFINILFVLAMLVVAFATIVRYDRYDAKKGSILTDLIIAAVLVNFSLAIAGVIINFSHSLTNVFLNEDVRDALPTALTEAFGPQKLLLGDVNPPPPDPADQGGLIAGIGAQMITSVMTAVFQIIFLLIAAVVMFALAFMLLMRYLHLTFLLTLSPLAFFARALPEFKHYFEEWWNEFLNWTFFLPAVSFFIYLTLATAKALAKITPTGNFFIGPMQAVVQQGIQMIMLTALLIGGMTAAQKMGIKGAEATMKGLKGAGNGIKNGAKSWAKNKAQRAGQSTAKGLAGSTFGQNTAKKLNTLGTKMQNIGKNKGFLGKIVTAPVRSIGKSVKGAGKGVVNTAKSQVVKPQSFVGSLFKGVGEGTGYWGKSKEKKGDEKKSKGEIKKDKKETQEKLDKIRNERQGMTADQIKQHKELYKDQEQELTKKLMGHQRELRGIEEDEISMKLNGSIKSYTDDQITEKERELIHESDEATRALARATTDEEREEKLDELTIINGAREKVRKEIEEREKQRNRRLQQNNRGAAVDPLPQAQTRPTLTIEQAQQAGIADEENPNITRGGGD